MSLASFLQSALDAARRRAPQDPRRSAPRIRVEPLHSIAFGWRSDAGEVDLPVANLSATGVALLRAGLEGLAPGPVLQGVLRLGSRRVPVALRQVHATGDVVGCRFEAPGRELVDAINAHLAAELSALEMVPVEEATLAHPGEGRAHWFHGRENSELYYEARGDEVRRFRICFLANVLEGGRSEPVRFGVLTGDRDLASDRAAEVRWLHKINAEQLSTTIRFVSGIPGLEPAHRDAILQLIC